MFWQELRCQIDRFLFAPDDRRKIEPINDKQRPGRMALAAEVEWSIHSHCPLSGALAHRAQQSHPMPMACTNSMFVLLRRQSIAQRLQHRHRFNSS